MKKSFLIYPIINISSHHFSGKIKLQLQSFGYNSVPNSLKYQKLVMKYLLMIKNQMF